MCSALAYLHQKGLVFRDLKPSNLMITAAGHVYLIDFGIARLFKGGQTQDTVALGSPGYAAPEQYGKAQSSPRSDIFSQRITLYNLATGDDPLEHPFSFPALDRLPDPMADLLRRMLAFDADQSDPRQQPRS